MMEMPAPDMSRTTFKPTQQCTYTAACALLNKWFSWKRFSSFCFVLPGNIYHQLNIVQESILLLNMLGQIMLPVNRVLKRSKIQKW